MAASFNVNEYVRYASNGICKITEISTFDAHDGKGAIEYYVLSPVASEKTTLYVPVENAVLTAKMRRVPSKAQLDEMILAVDRHSLLWQPDRKLRSEAFRDILKLCDQQQLLSLISCMYLKRQELTDAGKRFSATDSSILKQAERLIENDFSFVLGIKGNEVADYIRSLLKLNNSDNTEQI